MMTTTPLPSGSNFAGQIAPWQVAARLRWTLAAELKAVSLDFSSGIVQALLRAGAEPDKAKAKILALGALGSEDVDVLKNLLMQLVGSPTLESVIFECLVRCTLNGTKITAETFEGEGARADFYPAAVEVLKINILPFFGNLLSTLSLPKATETASTQK